MHTVYYVIRSESEWKKHRPQPRPTFDFLVHIGPRHPSKNSIFQKYKGEENEFF